MFDKINLAKDNIYKDWQRALEKKHLKAAMLMMKIGQISNYAVILYGASIYSGPSSNMVLQNSGGSIVKLSFFLLFKPISSCSCLAASDMYLNIVLNNIN